MKRSANRTTNHAHEHNASRPLPAQYYTSRDIFEEETDAIFSRTWQLACHTSSLSKPGDYITFDLLDESIIIMRSDDGAVRAFYNVCPHRAHRLLEGCGHIDLFIVCPYHAWCYDRSGALRRARNSQDIKDFELSSIHLTEVSSEVFCGFVFINLDPQAPAMKEIMPGVEEDMRRHVPRLDDLRPRHSKNEVIKANWKVAVENYSECYHCEVAHPVLAKTWYEVGAYEIDLRGQCMIHSTVTRDKMRNIPADLQVAEHFRAWVLFPYTAIQVFPGHLNVMRWIPIDENTHRFVEDWYVLSDELTAATLDDIKFRVDHTQAEDNAICENVQRGLRSRGYRTGPLFVDGTKKGTSEHGVLHHQSLVLAALTAER